MTFGSFLVKNHFVPQSLMEEALQNQSVLGARLGTNLVEVGALNVEQLEIYLAQFCGLPAVTPGEMDHLNRALLQTIPKRIIHKYRFLPLSKSGQMLRIAVQDPKNEEMFHEIRSVLGVKLEPCICSEIRLYFYLEHYYGIKAEVRFRSLFYHYRKSKAVGRELGAPQSVDPGQLDLLKKGFKPLSRGEELTDEGFEEYLMRETILRETPAAKVPAQQPTPESAPVEFAKIEEIAPIVPVPSKPETLLTLENLNQRLKTIQERNEIAELALTFASQFVEACVLFVVNAGLVSAWNAKSQKSARRLSKDTMGTVIVPLSIDSIFQTVQETKSHFKGRLSPTSINTRLLSALNIDPSQEVLVIPVWLKKRLVNILFADHGNEPISPPSFNALMALSNWLPRAYEHLILAHKRKL